MLKHEFDQLAAALGSTYAAVDYIAKSARRKLKVTNNRILESEAISWVLTGVSPKLRNRIDDVSHIPANYVDEILCYVDNENICNSVRDSYAASIQVRHLIYCYQKDLDKHEQSRVRILLRMVWYNIISEEEL